MLEFFGERLLGPERRCDERLQHANGDDENDDSPGYLQPERDFAWQRVGGGAIDAYDEDAQVHAHAQYAQRQGVQGLYVKHVADVFGEERQGAHAYERDLEAVAPPREVHGKDHVAQNF